MRIITSRDQFRHHAAHRVRRHGKANARAGPAGANDLRIDADHAALQVEQRPARVTRVDRRVGLDRLTDEPVFLRALDNPPQGADHAHRQRLFQAERVADRHHKLPHAHPVRVCQGDGHRQIAPHVDADHSQIVGRVRPHQHRLDLLAVRKGHQ